MGPFIKHTARPINQAQTNIPCYYPKTTQDPNPNTISPKLERPKPELAHATIGLPNLQVALSLGDPTCGLRQPLDSSRRWQKVPRLTVLITAATRHLGATLYITHPDRSTPQQLPPVIGISAKDQQWPPPRWNMPFLLEDQTVSNSNSVVNLK